MNITKKVLFLLVGSAMLFVAGCKQKEVMEPQSGSSMEISTEQVRDEITPVIQGFFDSQYRYLVGQDKKPQWNQYIENGSKELQIAMDRYMRIDGKDGARNIDYKSTAILKDAIITQKDATTWHLDMVYDHFTLMIQYSDEEPFASKGGWKYEFTVQYRNNSWMIIDWQESDGIGGNNRWYIATSNQLGYQGSEETNLGYSRSATYYNRATAISYALAHYNTPSGNYPDYASYGGDCTNFISQCLQAGGWTQTSTQLPRMSAQAWYHVLGSSMPTLSQRSASWTSARYLNDYLSQSTRVHTPHSLYAPYLGDVIQLEDWNGNIYHSMIVTRGYGADAYVTYRNATGYLPRVNRKLSSIASLPILHKLKTYYW